MTSYFDSKVNMTFIGHKELERNNVYLIPSNNQVLKVYSDKRRWQAEVASLKFLETKQLTVPRLIDYGIFEESLCWLVMTKLEGTLLLDVMKQITSDQLKKIYFDMGCLLSNFHNTCRIDQFGEWDENMNDLRNWSTFKEFEIEKNRKRANILVMQNYDENKLFKAGYSKMISLEDSLNSVSSFSLCHNDFSDRNILVEETDKDIKIVGLIDFELSYPSDTESDLAKMLIKNYFNNDIGSFISGYRTNVKLSNNFDDKHKYYLLSLCLEICSWSKDRAYDYYRQAVDVLEQLV